MLIFLDIHFLTASPVRSAEMRPIATDVTRSVVCVSVCLSVCLCWAVKNDWTDRDAVWGKGWLKSVQGIWWGPVQTDHAKVQFGVDICRTYTRVHCALFAYRRGRMCLLSTSADEWIRLHEGW